MAERPKSLWLRLLFLIFVLGGLFLIGHLTGFNESFDRESLRQWVQDAGPLGSLLLVCAFIAGLLVQIPGMLFVVVGIWVYGQFWGGLLAHVGGVLALSVSFVIVRGIGGKPLGAIKNKHARHIFDRLHDAPIKTVALLRLFFWFSPPLNYALALSGIRLRDYALGSAIGLIPVVATTSIFFDLVSSMLTGF